MTTVQRIYACRSRDLVRGRSFLLMWVWTSALITGQFVWQTAAPWLAATLLLSWGSFCTVNMIRCGRLHCYITGPVFLVAGTALLLLLLGAVSFPGAWINALALGALALGILLEIWRGKYAGSVSK